MRDFALKILDFLGTVWFATIIGFVLLLFIGWARAFRFGFIAGGVMLLGVIIKEIVARPRPEMSDRQNDRSFPSGHAIVATLLALYVFMWMMDKKNVQLVWKIGFGILCALAAFFTAYSRIYINYHFMDDMVAGMILAIAGYFICDFLYRFALKKWLKNWRWYLWCDKWKGLYARKKQVANKPEL
jgi:undecaprenyl-diphosphatase